MSEYIEKSQIAASSTAVSSSILGRETESDRESKRIFRLSHSIEPLIRDYSGIYCLLKGLEVIYVGQSIKVLSRIRDHYLEGSKDFDRYTGFSCEVDQLNELEAEYIVRLHPKLNKNLPPNKKYLTACAVQVFARDKLGRPFGRRMREVLELTHSVISHEVGGNRYYEIDSVVQWLESIDEGTRQLEIAPAHRGTQP